MGVLQSGISPMMAIAAEVMNCAFIIPNMKPYEANALDSNNFNRPLV